MHGGRADEADGSEEIDWWLAQPGILDDIARARAEFRDGVTLDEEQVRVRYSLLDVESERDG